MRFNNSLPRTTRTGTTVADETSRATTPTPIIRKKVRKFGECVLCR